MPEMTIGQVAKAAGVNVETIRFYQRMKLVPQPPRPPGGVRRYSPDIVARLEFIRRAQRLGFSLAEIGRLLRLEKRQSCQRARALAKEKLAAIDARMADLARIRGTLEALLDRCEAGDASLACPIIASLSTASPVRDRRTEGLARDPALP